jgi:uncharacterized protein DUF6624
MSSAQWCLVAFGFLAGCSRSDIRESSSSASTRDRVIPDSIGQELARLGTEDQEIRQGLTAQRMQDTAFVKTMVRGDSARTARLQVIVEQYGWPDPLRVGREAAQGAFLILQHSPNHEFQKQMVPEVEKLALAGHMPRSEAAMLIDRVLMHEGRPQRYGTQFTLTQGRWVLHPVEEEAGLEQRRKSMQLPTMEEYVRMMEEFYKTPVVR